MRARSRTRRCLVMAWRVRCESCASFEMDCRCLRLSLASSDRRVGSPRAAKVLAALGVRIAIDGRLRAAALWVLCDIVTDVGHLLRPAAVVAEKGFAAAGIGNVIEAGLGKPEERAAGSGGLEAEFDEGRDFFGVIDVGIDRVGMPGEGEVLL